MKYHARNKIITDDRLCYLNIVGSEIVLLNNDATNDSYQCEFTLRELSEIENKYNFTIINNDNWELEEVVG